MRSLAGLLALLSLLAIAPPASAAVSGANGRIAWVRADSGTDRRIWTMNPDGSDKKPLTNEGFSDNGPQWSPDGTRIVFRSDRGGGGIWLVDVATGAVSQQTTMPGDQDPTWAPDGTRIMFVRNNDFWIKNINGGVPINVTNSGDAEQVPDFSPDGSRIAYVNDPAAKAGEQGELWTMASNGTARARLTPDVALTELDPEWSPDGGRILFRRGTADDDLWLINSDGSGQRNLTNNAGTVSKNGARWSPDGRRIVLSTAFGPSNSEVGTIATDGPYEFQRLTDDPVIESQVDWQTVPAGDLALTLNRSTEAVAPNAPVGYTVRVVNNGPKASAATVSIPLPSGVVADSAVPSAGTCTAGATCNLGELAPGAQATVQLSLRAAQPGTYPVSATVTGSLADQNPGNESATLPFTVVPGRDVTAPALKLGGGRLQRILKRRYVVVSVSPSEDSAVSGAGRIALPRARGAKGSRAVKLRTVRREVRGGTTVRLKLKVSKRGAKQLRRGFRARKRLTARLTVSARDAAGNRGVAKRAVRVRR